MIKYSFAASGTSRTRFFALHFQPPGRFPPSLALTSFLSSLILFALFPLSAHPRSLTAHSSHYIRVRSLLAITPARLQIALPPTLLALMLARRKRRGKRDRGLCARVKRCRARKNASKRGGGTHIACVRNVASRRRTSGGERKYLHSQSSSTPAKNESKHDGCFSYGNFFHYETMFALCETEIMRRKC